MSVQSDGESKYKSRSKKLEKKI